MQLHFEHRRTSRAPQRSFALHCALAGAFCTISSAFAQSHGISLVSLSSQGRAANATSALGAVSSDGRYVAFTSFASNLVAGDTNATSDVFVRDTATGTTVRVDVSSTGEQANAGPYGGYPVAISDDGRRIAFASEASNLVAGDTNGAADVFVHDLADGTTRRVSVATGGGQATQRSERPAISGDGRFVAFVSGASELVGGDTNGAPDVFVHDLGTGRTERVSVGGAGAQGNLGAYADAAISRDGRFVAFTSNATNLAASDANHASDVFLRDRATGVTELISANAIGIPANRASRAPDVSDDGRFVSFLSDAQDLAAPDKGITTDLFLRDRANGTTTRINVDALGAASPKVRGASISADGRLVAFWFEAVPTGQVWLYDQVIARVQPVNVNLNGAQNNNASGAAISADGRWVGFTSSDLHLASNDTNGGVADAFVWDRWGTPRTVCAADDQLMIACPCAAPNTVPSPQAAPEHGCANSRNASGAVLHGNGALVPDEMRFRADIAPSYGGFAFAIRGDAFNADGLGAGDGIRCVTGALVRFGAHLSGTNGDALGEWTYPNAVQTTPISSVTAQPFASSAYYQVVYRDVAAGFCNASTFNVTSALEIYWP